ncbi:MAG: tetratricopeptide repeat protein, partial [Dehalococcoidales bacterium]|nr:tetratricopeptide repeat protein [Dehalococcoidales bacterium]
GRWREAVAANEKLIESFPNDIDAYNRLGKAYTELGDHSQAKEAYQRAIELNPYNASARKNLRRLSRLEETMTGSEGDSHKVEPQHFIEEIGKAGVVNLHHLGPPGVLARMAAGDKVQLKVAGSNLDVENSRGEYLGRVEPKQGQRLIKLMEGGNKYTAAVISSAEDMITIIIREVYQDPSQAGKLSFPAKKIEELRPYISDRIFRHELEYEAPDYTLMGDEDLLPEEISETEEESESEE